MVLTIERRGFNFILRKGRTIVYGPISPVSVLSLVDDHLLDSSKLFGGLIYNWKGVVWPTFKANI